MFVYAEISKSIPYKMFEYAEISKSIPYKMFVYAEISKSMFKKVYSTTAIVIVQVLNLPYIEAIITQGQCLRRNIKLIKQTH